MNDLALQMPEPVPAASHQSDQALRIDMAPPSPAMVHNPPAPAAPPVAAPPPAGREQAKRVLAATAKKQRPALDNRLLLGGGGALAVVGMLGWLWWASQPVPSTPAESEPSVVVQAEQPAISSNPPVQEPIPAVTAPPPVTPSPTPASSPATQAVVKAYPQAQTAAVLISEPVKISRAVAPDTVSPLLTKAYAAYQAQDWNAATLSYQQALANEPTNRDALLGLATLAARAGQSQDAERWYRQMLALDPQDRDALAGLAVAGRQMADGDRVQQLESLLRSQPDSPLLMQELAAAYHQQQRWADAQQLYFQLFTLQPDRPDTAFNLAVSLEHLDQPRLALRYYQQALQLARQQPAQFSPAAVTERIAKLQEGNPSQ